MILLRQKIFVSIKNMKKFLEGGLSLGEANGKLFKEGEEGYKKFRKLMRSYKKKTKVGRKFNNWEKTEAGEGHRIRIKKLDTARRMKEQRWRKHRVKSYKQSKIKQ